MLHGPIWIDISGEFWPVKHMSVTRLRNCLGFVQNKLKKLENPIVTVQNAYGLLRGEHALDTVDSYMESYQIDVDMERYIRQRVELQQWELLFAKALKTKGIDVGGEEREKNNGKVPS